jgi:hypothetical protein
LQDGLHKQAAKARADWDIGSNSGGMRSNSGRMGTAEIEATAAGDEAPMAALEAAAAARQKLTPSSSSRSRKSRI